jgi:hypothetical protein
MDLQRMNWFQYFPVLNECSVFVFWVLKIFYHKIINRFIGYLMCCYRTSISKPSAFDLC